MTTDELATWAAEFAAFHARLADLFARAEPRAQVAKYLRGLLTCGERKNGWHLAELMGDATPDRMQRLLFQADWDAAAARDRLQQFVVERFGDPDGIWPGRSGGASVAFRPGAATTAAARRADPPLS